MLIQVLPKVESVILISGETGTGKSTLAKKIHLQSTRKNLPFIVVDLASISESLIESELFGHKKGSFTGAICEKEGFLSLVKGGTLFLDEIGEVSQAIQKKLLRLIEDKTYYPVGSTTAKTFSGTIIAATHNNLEQRIIEGTFREDLYYRLSVFNYLIKPLRERPQELENLIFNIFNDLKVKFQKYHLILSECSLKVLQSYSWKGNIRELKNVLEYVILTCNQQITSEFLPIKLLNDCNKVVESNFHNAVMDFEKNFLEQSLLKYNGRINQTSHEIGISKVTLISKIKKYDINIADIKSKFQKDKVVGL